MNFISTRTKRARRFLASLCAVAAFSGSMMAQLSGTKNIPGDYASLALAITDLNTVGVGPGGVTLNVISGNPETAPAGGYAITATGTSANPIMIAGNANVITASGTQTVGALNDAIFSIIGGDYITISGFNMQENAANTATTAASNNMTEFGVALFYASATDGAQNVTIQTNTISLNRTYPNTFGIYSNSTHNATAVTTASTATGATGGNNALKVYGNNISNVNIGIVVVGPTAAADMSTGLDIGGTSAAQGNTITNYGTTGTFSGYNAVSGTVNGILVRNSLNYNVSYNTVASSNGGVTSGSINGIYIPSFSNTPTGSQNNIIRNNNLSVKSGAAGSTLQGISVESGTSSNTSTLTISNNDFNNFGHTVAGTSAITFINAADIVASLVVNSNTFTNLNVNTTGSVTFISHGYSMPLGAFQTFNANSIVTAFNKTGAGGTITGLTSGSSSANGSNSIQTNNNFSNITVTGATAITGISNSDGSGSSPNRTVTGNIFTNWTGGTSAIIGMSYSYIGSTSTISGNTLSNITGQGAITGLNIGSSFSGGNPFTVANNTITSLSSTGTGGAVVGITCSNTSAVININNNFVNTLSTSAASSVRGIVVSGAATTNVFKNKIYDLSGSNAGTTLTGILVSGGTTINTYNNTIGDLRAPVASGSNVIVGISLTGGTTNNLYYNTVLLSASTSGANFGTTCLSVTTNNTFTSRNNIFINNSTPAGTGIAAAFRKNNTTMTGYTTASNNNLFYAGTPGASNVIFYDGTTGQQTLAAFKTYIGGTKDAASVSENVTFASTTGSSASFLHISNGTTTTAESGASNITGITDDFDGDIRQGNAGYAGTGTSPDIGADEFNGITPAPAINSVSITPTGNQCTAVSRNVTANVTAGAAPITSVTVNYSFNGVAQTPITMTGGTTTGTSVWNATLPVATPVNATVTWTVVVTDGTFIKSQAGASYADAPLMGLSAAATASLNPVCAGNTSTLSAAVPAAIQIGAGALTTSGSGGSGGNSVSPFSHYYGGGRFEYMIRASELTAQGLGAGNITSVAFDVTTAGISYNGFAINVTQTSSTDLSGGFVTAGLTSVYAGTVTPVVGINTYTFSTPYFWDGTSNLVIHVCWSNNNTGGTAAEVRYDNTSYVSEFFNRADSQAPAAECSATSNSGSNSARPKMIIGGNRVAGMTFAWSDGVSTVGTTNPLLVTPTVTTTYSVTLTDPNSCTLVSSPVTLTVTPLPIAPTTTNSSQCGVGVPTAQVGGGSSYNWYATPTSTTVLQSGANTNYTTSIGSTTTFYVSSVSGACEGPRAAVTATVTIPDGVVASTSNANLCPGGTATLTATQTGTTNPYVFTWTASPVTGSGMPSPVSGTVAVVSPTIIGTYMYSVTATDGVCTTISSVSVTVNGIPDISNVTATPSVICSGSAVNLNAISNIVSTGTVAIGTTTTNLTGATTQPTAFCNRWPSYQMQTVFTAAELSAAGLNAGNITSIAYNITTLGDANNNANYTVKCGTTTATSFTNFVPNGSFTTVFGPVNYIHAVGLNTITFSTPFNWDGVSNIIIEVTHDGADQINNSVTYYTPTAANTVAWANSGSATGNPSNQRLNIIFGGQTFVPNTGNVTWQWNPGAINTNTAVVNPTNPGTAPITQVYTVTATNPVTTCSNSATATVTINPIPTMPLTTNSSQCGFGVPTASVSGGTSYNWYASPTSTTVLQAGTSTNYTTSINNTTTFYVSSFDGNCESPRAAITASVTIPDAVTAMASSTLICPGNSVTLTAVQTGTNNPYVFTWVASPAAGSGMPGTVSGATTVATPNISGTYIYSVTATDGICTTVSTVNVTLNNVPNISNVSATPSVVCSGGNVMLNASSYAAAAGTATVGTQSTTDLTGGPFRSGAGTDNKVQYLITASELSAAGITPGNITSLSFSVTSLGTGTMPNYTIKIGSTASTSLTTVFDASPLTTVYGPSAYTAVANLNTFTFTTPFNWNGTSNVLVQICHDAVSSGSSYVSMTSTANKTIYATVTAACTQTAGTAYSTYRPMMLFNSQVGTNVSSSMNWMWNPGAIPTNTASVNPTNPGTTPVTQVYTITATDPVTTCTNSATASVTVNPLPAIPSVFNSVQCGVGVPTASVSGGTSYNWYATPTSTTVLQSGATATFTSSISNTTTYYVSSFNGTCESPRATVTASVNVPDAITASVSSASICPGTSATLTAVNTGTTNNYSYTWTASPASGSGIPTSVSGASVSIMPTLPGTYVYTVTGVDGVCTAVTTTSLNVFQALTVPPVTSASPNPLCAGGTTSLNATVPTSVAIGTGATTLGASSSGGGLSPYSQYYEGQRTQYLFRASELTAQGLNAGNLASITFSVTSPLATMTFTNYTMKMYNTAATDLASAYATASGPMTTVYGPAQLAAPAAGLNTISFSSMFNWDGTSNIILDVCFENDPSSTGIFYTNNSIVAATNMGYTAVRGDYADNSSLCNTSNTGSSATSNNRPYAVFTSASTYSFSWSNGSVVGTSNPQPVSPTVTTTYTAVITDGNGCSITSAPVTVTVNPIPSVSVTPITTSVCAGSPAVLTASGATSYTWTPGTGLTTASVTVTPTVTTTYTVTGASLGCSGTNTVMVTATPIPTLVTTASSPSICSGGSATLTVSGADTYSWTPGAQTATMIVVSPTVTTNYSVVGTSTVAGCSTTSTVNLVVNNVPSLTVTPASPTICANSTTTLTGSGATSYSWSSGSTTNTAVVTPSTTTTYTLTGTNACGTTTATAMVATVTTPTVTASATSTLLCAGSSATITAGGAATYSWSSGQSVATISVTPNASTAYTVTGTNACGSATAVASVSVAPIPTVTAVSSRTSICNGDFAVLSGGGATSYTWMPGGATTSSIVVSPTITATYTLTGKTSAGCVNTAVVSQLVLPCTGINEVTTASGIDIYPNPNVGSVNIIIPGELAGHSSIQVFDAIGKLVIKENLTDESTHLNTSRLEEGLYIYKIFDNNGVIVKVGRMVRNK